MPRFVRLTTAVLLAAVAAALGVVLLAEFALPAGEAARWARRTGTSVVLAGILGLIVLELGRSLYFRIGGRHGEVSGFESLVADAVLDFDPITIDSGVWRLTVTASAGAIEAELDQKHPGRSFDGGPIRVSSRGHGRHGSGPLREWEFFTERPASKPVRLRLRLRLRYEPPSAEHRSFRLTRTVPGEVLALGWRVTLDGWCAVSTFPGPPIRRDAARGVPAGLPSPAAGVARGP